MKRFLTIFSAAVVFLFIATIPFITSAAPIEFKNPLKSGDAMALIQSVVAQLIPLAITVLTLLIIWGGFKYVLASHTGSEGEMTKAKNFLFFVLAISAIVAGASMIVNAIVKFAKEI